MRILSVKNLSVSYENKIALQNVSFEVSLGDCIGIVGENGAGKSTLIKAILGLQNIKSGTVCFENISRSEFGYLPQQSFVQRDFPASVNEVVLSGCAANLFFSKEDKEKAARMMRRLSIWELRNYSYMELSKGQQQRVLLARALCSAEKLLVLDEPAAGLDYAVTSELYALINDINKNMGITVIVVSHDIDSAVRYFEKILHVNVGIRYFGEACGYVRSKYWGDIV